MSKDITIQAMGHIEDHILERYIHAADRIAARKAARKLWLRVAAAAACLALIVTGFVMWYPAAQDPPRAITVEDIHSVFPALESSTSSYRKKTVPDSAYLNLNAVPEQEYITVYRDNRIYAPLNEDMLAGFADSRLAKLAEMVNEKVPEYTLQKSILSDKYVDSYLDSYYFDHLSGEVTLGNLKVSFEQREDRCFFAFSADYRSDDQSISLDGERVQVDQRQTDEEILLSFESIKQKLFEIFDVSFTDAKITRYYSSTGDHGVNTMMIYFYNKNDHPVNESSRTIVSDYITISFYNYSNDDDFVPSDSILTDVSIIYRHQLPQLDEKYDEAQYRMLSLSEAEDYLYKGYVFGGYGCSFCMALQDPVSFEDYDFVSFEYLEDVRHSRSNDSLVIPFYVFYKEIETNENGTTYAYTYVPAIEVEGLDDYFASQQNQHDKD